MGASPHRGESMITAATRAPSFELYVETGSVSRIQNSWPAGIDLQVRSWAFAPAQNARAKAKREIALLNEMFIAGRRFMLRFRIIRIPIFSGPAFRAAGELYPYRPELSSLILQRLFFTR